MNVIKRCLMVVVMAAGVGAAGTSRGATYSYVDWMTADVAMGTASGTITLSDGSKVMVDFEAVNPDGSRGNLFGAQFDGGGTNYWMPATPYMSSQVENAPPGTDILQLKGGENQIYRVKLSEAIKDPVMAIVSLGAPGTPITYDFDSPFTIVSQGAGFWGGGPDKLVQMPGDVLGGEEGHGTIQFIGTFSTFSWTAPLPETWHGFTFAIRTTERLEPPDAGADGGADAAPPADAAVVADAAADRPADTAATIDAASDASGDAGPKGKSDDCDCSLGGGRRGTGSGLLPALSVLVFAALFVRRRRRARRP